MSESASGSGLSQPFVVGFVSALALGGLGVVLTRGRSPRAAIRRWKDSPRSCAALEHNGVVYLSGQVGDLDKLETSDAAEQTRQTLRKIDGLLADAGTSKENILSSQIWVKDITEHFEPMNGVWNAWVSPKNKGVRACVEARMARQGILVEIKVIAALP